MTIVTFRLTLLLSVEFTGMTIHIHHNYSILVNDGYFREFRHQS